MTAPNLFAKHTEGLERRVVFSVSSKPRVITLWPFYSRDFSVGLAIKSRLRRRPSHSAGPTCAVQSGWGELRPGRAKPRKDACLGGLMEAVAPSQTLLRGGC